DALFWTLKNAQQMGGFPGYRKIPKQKYQSFDNKSWQDSFDSLIHRNGDFAPWPRKTVETVSWTWSAWMYGADLFDRTDHQDTDHTFSSQLRDSAGLMRQKFNSPT